MQKDSDKYTIDVSSDGVVVTQVLMAVDGEDSFPAKERNLIIMCVVDWLSGPRLYHLPSSFLLNVNNNIGTQVLMQGTWVARVSF